MVDLLLYAGSRLMYRVLASRGDQRKHQPRALVFGLKLHPGRVSVDAGILARDVEGDIVCATLAVTTCVLKAAYFRHMHGVPLLSGSGLAFGLTLFHSTLLPGQAKPLAHASAHCLSGSAQNG